MIIVYHIVDPTAATIVIVVYHRVDPTAATIMSLNLTSPNNLGAVRSETSNLLMCKQWWRVCWTYGDQYKQYRHLYSKKTKINTLRTKEIEKEKKETKENKEESDHICDEG